MIRVLHVGTMPRRPEHDPRLTEREVAVLRRIAHSESNAEIAKVLYISPATARTYVSRILTKLQARDRTELAVITHRAGRYGSGPGSSPVISAFRPSSKLSWSMRAAWARSRCAWCRWAKRPR